MDFISDQLTQPIGHDDDDDDDDDADDDDADTDDDADEQWTLFRRFRFCIDEKGSRS